MNGLRTIGLYQFNIFWEEIDRNIFKLQNLLVQQKPLPDILFLPEMFTTGFTMEPEKLDPDRLSRQLEVLINLSGTYKITIIGSVIWPSKENKFCNRLFAILPDGSYQWYDKRHLFFNEASSQKFIKGETRNIIDVENLKIFPQICYDLRFPVWSCNNLGYDILFYSANWPASRQDVWNTLLPARAIENQCYVIGVNRVGTDENGIEYIGGSVVYSPKGECLLQLSGAESFGSVDISLDELYYFRKKFPVLRDIDDFTLDIKKG